MLRPTPHFTTEAPMWTDVTTFDGSLVMRVRSDLDVHSIVQAYAPSIMAPSPTGYVIAPYQTTFRGGWVNVWEYAGECLMRLRAGGNFDAVLAGYFVFDREMEVWGGGEEQIVKVIPNLCAGHRYDPDPSEDPAECWESRCTSASHDPLAALRSLAGQ